MDDLDSMLLQDSILMYQNSGSAGLELLFLELVPSEQFFARFT